MTDDQTTPTLFHNEGSDSICDFHFLEVLKARVLVLESRYCKMARKTSRGRNKGLCLSLVEISRTLRAAISDESRCPMAKGLLPE